VGNVIVGDWPGNSRCSDSSTEENAVIPASLDIYLYQTVGNRAIEPIELSDEDSKKLL